MSNILAQLAFDNEMRTEQILHLATMCATESMADAADEAFSSDWDSILTAMGIDPDGCSHSLELDEVMMDRNLYGFLVQIGTPVPLHFHDDGSYTTGGFGIYATQWFYGESIDEIYTKAAQWKSEYINNKREKALSKEATKC